MNPAHDHTEGRNLKMAFLINTAFAILELVGGIWTNSLAILSDALHDLGDSFSLGLAWYFQKLSTRKPDARFTYGYRRFSVLGALLNGLVLFSGSVLIVYHAIPRLIHPEEANAMGMIWLAFVGIAVNGAAALRLSKSTSINSRVARLHLLEDVLGWVTVLVGAVVIRFTEWYVVDSILSIGIALFILFNVLRNLRQTIAVMLQSVPSHIDMERVQREALAVQGVNEIHDLRVWSLDGERSILTAHIVVDASDPADQLGVKNEVKERLRALGIVHCTLELERPEDCSNDPTALQKG